MPGPFNQWLYLVSGDTLTEVVNGARTATYLQTLGIGGIDICSVLDLATACPAYNFIPAETDSGGNVIYDIYSSCDISEIEYSTPSQDPAPWYNEDYPESEEAFGFYIEEWTGLDSRHLTRSTTRRGGAGSGVTFGPASSGGRVQKINILLMASSEKSMQYLFDWLDTTLIGSCSACATDNLLYQRWCEDDPDAIDTLLSVGEQRRVALVEGLQWEDDIEGVGKCFIRRASFTLTAGDPCIYDLGTDTEATLHLDDLVDCWADAALNPDRYPCRPSCSELPEGCSYVIEGSWSGTGAGAPVITLDNNYDTFSMPLRVIVYSNPNGIDWDERCGLPVLGEIYVTPLPPYSKLTWDVPGRRVLYRDVTTGSDVLSSAYLAANDPPITRWFTLPCPGDFLIVMQIGDLCLTEDGGDVTWPAGGIEFTDPHFPDIDFSITSRMSCP